ncbi:MAG: hypothetical protein RBG13Loki_1535 [Promethearchaeota archaeon CR_4]|nr:MAG: hypothetical protein RBG13Loki_1535 [Candidatus Lokiarchaeota archaeon CR_4]
MTMERFRRIFEEEFERGKQAGKTIVEETPDTWLTAHGQVHPLFGEFPPTSRDFKEIYFEREPETRAFARLLGMFFEHRQFLHYALIAPCGMGKTYFVAGLCMALRAKMPGSAEFWNIVDTPRNVLSSQEEKYWFELKEVRESAFFALIMPPTGSGISEIIRTCRQERKFLLTVWTPSEFRQVDKIALGVARELTLAKLSKSDLHQLVWKRIEYCGLSRVFPPEALDPIINVSRGNPGSFWAILDAVFKEELYPQDLPALTPEVSKNFVAKVDFETIFANELNLKDLRFLEILLEEEECELTHLASALDWTYNQTWRRTMRLADIKVIKVDTTSRKLRIWVNPLIQTWVEEKMMHS